MRVIGVEKASSKDVHFLPSINSGSRTPFYTSFSKIVKTRNARTIFILFQIDAIQHPS